MDALELTMKSSNLIKRVLNTTPTTPQISSSCAVSSQNSINIRQSSLNEHSSKSVKTNNSNHSNNSNSTVISELKENEIENEHFKDIDVCDDINLTDSDKNSSDDDCSFNSSIIAASVNNDYEDSVEYTRYVQSPPEELGEVLRYFYLKKLINFILQLNTTNLLYNEF